MQALPEKNCEVSVKHPCNLARSAHNTLVRSAQRCELARRTDMQSTHRCGVISGRSDTAATLRARLPQMTHVEATTAAQHERPLRMVSRLAFHWVRGRVSEGTATRRSDGCAPDDASPAHAVTADPTPAEPQR